MELTINSNWSRAEVEDLLHTLPAALAGSGPDPHGLADGFKARLAHGWMGLVKQDYDEQHGGTRSGRLGESLQQGGLNDCGASAEYLPPNDDQYYDASKPGEVSIGTNLEYARHVHARRPLWPEEELPQEWEDGMLQAAREGIQKIVEIVAG